MARPFALRLFVPSGQPEGMRIVEKTNWSGIGFVVPRSQLKEFTQRQDASRPGVYVLSGPDPDGGQDLVYIGEADPLARRLEQHQAKDFWTVAYAFTSKDGYLNKAHAQYLEAELIGRAQEAKRCHLENTISGRGVQLAEMDTAEAQGYLDELLLCCPVLGLRVFEQPQRVSTRAKKDVFRLSGPHAEGRGYESPNGFTVLKGAKSRTKFVPTAPESVKKIRGQLLSQGVFADRGEHLELLQDYEFSSPSAAACILLARSANGRIEWRDVNDISLKEYQDRAAAAASGGSSA